MRITCALSFVLLVGCSPKAPPKEPEAPEPAPNTAPSDETAPAEPSAAGTCQSRADCDGGYCQRSVMSEPACTADPDIMNAVILCKDVKDCEGLCVAFTGSEQCGSELGTCNCDGPKAP
jgi:hypothetical protein